MKFFYSPQVTREATQRRVFGTEWPKHIATLAEVEERAAREDPLRHIPAAAKTFPSLSVLVFESEQHHVADAADHPNAVAQVNAWIDAGARWVRFNPDAHYVEAMMGKKPTQSIQFPAGKRLQRETIRNFLEPKDSSGGPTDKQAMTAAVCELADRTYRNEWAPVLERVLVPQK